MFLRNSILRAGMALAIAFLFLSGPAIAADTASSSMGTWSGAVANMVDGDLNTFWKSNKAPASGDWVRVDRGSVQPVTQIDLYMTEPGSPNDRIEQGVIEVSSDGTSWTSLGSFSNQNEVHVTAPANTSARYIRARATASQSYWVVVREFAVNRPLASSSMGTWAGKVADMVDGDLNTFWKSNEAPASGDWVQVNLGITKPVTQVDLYMTEPGSPNDRIEQGVIEVSGDGTNWTSLGSFANQNEVHVTPPANTSARYVRARATASQSYWVVVREFTISTSGTGGDTTPPAAPVTLVATATSCSQIDLDWADNVETDLASYSVYRSTTSGFTPSASNRVASGLTASAYSNTGLAASTMYYYKVTALDTSGNESAPSVEASDMTTGGCDTTAPAAPAGLTATSVSSSQINLDWTDNSETDLASYSVYRSTTSGFTPSASNRIASGVTTSAYSNTGLTASTTYYYKITALDTSGNESAASAQASATTASAGGGTPTPPGQPTSGPGSATYPHGDWIVSQGGSGNDAWYVFQPTNPRPASAPVAIMIHGFAEYSGYAAFQEMIRHTVRKGYIVIYPRWQTSLFSPGTSIGPTLTAAVNGVKGGLNWLQADPANRVQPQLDKVAYMGHSFGGMIAVNMANRYQSLSLPEPKAVYMYEPGGGQAGDQFDDPMTGIPASTKVVCHVSDDATTAGIGCYKVFPLFGHVPNENKDFIMMYDDTYGNPDLVADHFAICSPPSGVECYPGFGVTGPAVDAMDWYAFWKPWIGLLSCAINGTDCQYGLNDTPEHRFMGLWSDGTPVRELRITDTAQMP